MPETFFWSWAPWAKLGFILGGCFIIITVLAIGSKLFKMRRLHHLRQSLCQDLEHNQLKEKLSDQNVVPFGVKSMREDPIVEGVWNSRASTPLQSPVLKPQKNRNPSLNPFSRSRRNSSVSSLIRLEPPESTETSPVVDTFPANVWSSQNDMAQNFEHANDTTTERNIDHQYENPETIESLVTMPRRRSVTIRGPPREPGSFDGSRGDAPEFDTTRRLTSLDNISLGTASSGSMGKSRVATDPTPSTPSSGRQGGTLISIGISTPGTTPDHTPTTKSALLRMEAHRKFHTAESGQLRPRSRSRDNDASGHQHSSSDTVTAEYASNRAVSWPISTTEVLVDFHAPRKVETKTSPKVVPFRAFVESHPPPPDKVSLPPSSWTSRTQDLLEEQLETQSRKRMSSKNEHVSSPLQLENLPLQTGTSTSGISTSRLGTRHRQANPGFEILPAGSLTKTPSFKDFGDRRSQEEVLADRNKPRKLQRRNRSSDDKGRKSQDSQKSLKV